MLWFCVPWKVCTLSLLRLTAASPPPAIVGDDAPVSSSLRCDAGVVLPALCCCGGTGCIPPRGLLPFRVIGEFGSCGECGGRSVVPSNEDITLPPGCWREGERVDCPQPPLDDENAAVPVIVVVLTSELTEPEIPGKLPDAHLRLLHDRIAIGDALLPPKRVGVEVSPLIFGAVGTTTRPDSPSVTPSTSLPPFPSSPSEGAGCTRTRCKR